MALHTEKGDVMMSTRSSLDPNSTAVSLAAPTAENVLTNQVSRSSVRSYYTGTKLYAVLGALMLVTLLIALDAMILATAIPYITDDFHTIADVGWYVSAYMICNSALQPLTGKVFTYFDLTLSYLAFLAVFEIGSIICAASRSSPMLVIGRAVSGMGGSGLMNGAITMLSIAAPPHQRPMLIGLCMSVFAFGQIIGPLIGGSLTQHASWRWCFWINLPIGAIAAVALFLLRIHNPDQRRGLELSKFIEQFDIVGFVVFAPACIMLLLALQWGGNEYSWNSATVIGLLVGSVVAFAVFIVWESRQGDHAMFPASQMKKRVIYSSCVTTAVNAGALFIAAYYIPLWFQAIKRESPTMSAVYTLPTFGMQIVTVILAGALARVVGFFTPFALLGTSLTAIATGLMCTFNPGTKAGAFIGYQVLLGAGRGFGIQQPMNAVQASLKGDQMPTGMAIIAWAQFFGAAVFIALGQAAFTSFLRAAIPDFVPNINAIAVIYAGATNFVNLAQGDNAVRNALLAAYNQAIVRTFYLATACAVVATFTSFGLGWKRVIKKPDATEKSKKDNNDKKKNSEVENDETTEPAPKNETKAASSEKRAESSDDEIDTVAIHETRKADVEP